MKKRNELKRARTHKHRCVYVSAPCDGFTYDLARKKKHNEAKRLFIGNKLIKIYSEKKTSDVQRNELDIFT